MRCPWLQQVLSLDVDVEAICEREKDCSVCRGYVGTGQDKVEWRDKAELKMICRAIEFCPLKS